MIVRKKPSVLLGGDLNTPRKAGYIGPVNDALEGNRLQRAKGNIAEVLKRRQRARALMKSRKVKN